VHSLKPFPVFYAQHGGFSLSLGEMFARVWKGSEVQGGLRGGMIEWV